MAGCSIDGCEKPLRSSGATYCAMHYHRAYRAANPDLRAKQQAYRAANAKRIAAVEKAWRDAHPDRVREVSRAWYVANAERISAESKQRWVTDPDFRAGHASQAKAWREANVDKCRVAQSRAFQRNKTKRVEGMRAWRQANPEKIAVLKNRRRARIMTDADLTNDHWLEILAEFDGHCAYCQRADLPLVLEHMTPLARGGRHTRNNVVPACSPCNSRKHVRTALEFAGLALVAI